MNLKQMFSTKNVGKADSIIRILLGLVLFYMVFSNQIVGTMGIIALIVALVLFFTAVRRSCALYSVLGMNTCEAGK